MQRSRSSAISGEIGIGFSKVSFGKRHPRRAGPVPERQVLQRALAALVADRAVERVVDEDELERRVLPLRCLGGGRRGPHHHPVLRGERAARLQLREPLHLDEAHAAGADRRPEPRLVAEDRDLDPRRRGRLDEAGALRHLHLAVVDRQRDRVAHASTPSGRSIRPTPWAWMWRSWTVTGARIPSSEDAPLERAAAFVDMRLELVPELGHVADDRDRVGVAQRAEALAVDPLGDVEQQVEVALRAAPLLDLQQDLRQPLGADAARRALAARLVLVELRDADTELHHAAAVVEDDDGGRAHRRPGGGHRVEVERHLVDLGGREDRRRGATGDDRLERPPAGDAAALLVDEVAQRVAVRQLVVAAAHDVPGEREDPRARRGLDPELRVLGAAQLEDRRSRS